MMELPYGDRPIRFAGTDEERRANYLTHWFLTIGNPEDGETRCGDCDCRPSHVAADYPCGSNVPRETFG